MLTLLSIILFGLLAFSIAFRTRIASLIRGAGLYAAGTWNYVWPVIRGTVLTAIIIGGISWGILIVLMIGLGIYANSFWSAIIISFLFPVWFLAFIMPPVLNKIWIIGPMLQFTRLIFGPILIIATIFLLVGLWSPAIKGSLDRWTDNKKGEIANSLDKSSLKSEPEMGKFAKVTEDSQIYNQSGQPVFSIQKGTTVMIKDLDGKKTDANSEGMTKVMCPDRHGDYQKGNEGWIPTRKLNWDWQSKLQPEPRANVPAENQGSPWKIRYEKPEGGYSEWEKATVEKDGSQTIIRTVSNGRRIVFEGKEENGIFSGFWEQKDSPYKKGGFSFKTTLFEMEGYETDFQEGERKFPFQLKKF